MLFKDKTVLITGGTGSFGRALSQRLLQENLCLKVIILSRDEWKQWDMQQSDSLFQSPKIRFFLGDVRDRDRLTRAFQEVDYVIHAAALKQVPAAEYNPTEFVKTNVNGAMNVVDAAIAAGVKKVIALSSDKAVNPINMYGATKLCSDKLFVAANAYVGARGHPTFSVVRYGNVAGSRGSVIPFWRHLLQQGKKALPITDARMTRFWITLEEAVDFVIRCFEEAEGGEVFVPKLPSFKITDLLTALDAHALIENVGIREGEKLHELMISLDDARQSLEFGSHYIVYPSTALPPTNKKGVKLPAEFAYSSGTNTEWLNTEQLQHKLKTL